jgi:hypothetical protein
MNARSVSLVALLSAVASPVLAANQVVNSGFVTDLSGWSVVASPSFTASHATSQSFNTPGSLRVSTSGATASSLAVVRQCFTVTPGQVMDFGLKARHEGGHAASLRAFASVAWFNGGGCSGASSLGPSTNTTGAAPDSWNALHANDVVVPVGQASALFSLSIDIVAGEGVAFLDDAYFGPDPLTPVELQSLTIE